MHSCELYLWICANGFWLPLTIRRGLEWKSAIVTGFRRAWSRSSCNNFGDPLQQFSYPGPSKTANFYGMNLYRKHTDTPYEELAAAARQIQSEVYAQKH